MITKDEIRALRRYAPRGARFWYDTAGSLGYEIRLSSQMADGKTQWHNALFVEPEWSLPELADKFKSMAERHEKERGQ